MTAYDNYIRGMPTWLSVARPFNDYGPGLEMTDHRVLPDFARDVFAGRDMVMRSDGTPRRTFCYVADAVATILVDEGLRLAPIWYSGNREAAET